MGCSGLLGAGQSYGIPKRGCNCGFVEMCNAWIFVNLDAAFSLRCAGNPLIWHISLGRNNNMPAIYSFIFVYFPAHFWYYWNYWNRMLHHLACIISSRIMPLCALFTIVHLRSQASFWHTADNMPKLVCLLIYFFYVVRPRNHDCKWLLEHPSALHEVNALNEIREDSYPLAPYGQVCIWKGGRKRKPSAAETNVLLSAN